LRERQVHQQQDKRFNALIGLGIPRQTRKIVPASPLLEPPLEKREAQSPPCRAGTSIKRGTTRLRGP
jgi:hypothetical protein